MLGINDFDKTLAKSDVYDKRSEIEYQAARGGMRFVARRVTDGVASVFEGMAEMFASFMTNTVGGVLEAAVGAEMARDIAAFAGTFGSKLVGLLGMGLAAGVSAGFTEMDYVHQKRNILKFYSGELGARLHKSPADVTVQDMEKVAKDVPVLDQELRRARRQRNFGIPLAVATTLISFAAVAVALPGAAAALSISLPTGVVAKFLLNAAVSIGAYYAAKIPLQRIGNKALDLTEETANDRIFDIKRAHAMGKSITPAQVLDVYTKGNPGLDIEVIREFGKPYDKLGHEQQELAVAQLDSALKLTQTAQDINSGRILATELAFMTAGQTSGVPPTVPEQRDAVAQDAPQMTSTRFQDKLGKRDLAASFTDRVTQESSSPKEHHI